MLIANALILQHLGIVDDVKVLRASVAQRETISTLIDSLTRNHDSAVAYLQSLNTMGVVSVKVGNRVVDLYCLTRSRGRAVVSVSQKSTEAGDYVYDLAQDGWRVGGASCA